STRLGYNLGKKVGNRCYLGQSGLTGAPRSAKRQVEANGRGSTRQHDHLPSRMSVISRSVHAPPFPILADKAAPPPAMDRLWDRLAMAVLLIAAIVIALTFTGYGVTWDEDVHNWYGYFALDYYLSFFADQCALNWLNLYNYGAAFDMVAAAL